MELLTWPNRLSNLRVPVVYLGVGETVIIKCSILDIILYLKYYKLSNTQVNPKLIS